MRELINLSKHLAGLEEFVCGETTSSHRLAPFSGQLIAVASTHPGRG
jgi:hypothetical protein